MKRVLIRARCGKVVNPFRRLEENEPGARRKRKKRKWILRRKPSSGHLKTPSSPESCSKT
jgi:hypothetical protein